MGVVGTLVAKDLRRKLRAPVGLAVVLCFPLLFAGMIALVFGSRGEAVPKVRLLVENRDGDAFLSGALVSALTSSQMAEYFDVRVVKEGAALMGKGEASALLVIPEGFSQDVIDGKPVALSMVRNPSEGILPEIAEQTARTLVEVLDGGSRVLRPPLEQFRPYFGGDHPPQVTDESVSAIAVAFRKSIEGARTFILPPVITLEGAFERKPASAPGRRNPGSTSQIFLLVLPGVAVYSLFLIGDQGMRDLLTESAGGTLKRQLAGPINARTLLLGKTAFTALLSLLGLAIIAAIGAAVGETGADPAGFLLLSFALILAVTGASAMVYGFARTERQGATLASLVYLFLGFAGGCFVPLDSLPPSVRAFSPVSPFYWGAQGYRLLLTGGAGIGDILPHAAVLAGLGVLLLALGSVGLGRVLRRGAAA